MNNRKIGKWHPKDIQRLTSLASEVEGDFCEIGVHKGDTFQYVVHAAKEYGRAAHAVDSFRGMDEPSEFDDNTFPKGHFDVGGVVGFVQLMNAKGVDRDDYETWEGYIPSVFAGIPKNIRFSFVIIDVDHYRPTLQAIRWAWVNLSIGGIMALDDFNHAATNHSHKAIKEFLRENTEFDIVDFFNYQLILRKI